MRNHIKTLLTGVAIAGLTIWLVTGNPSPEPLVELAILLTAMATNDKPK